MDDRKQNNKKAEEKTPYNKSMQRSGAESRVPVIYYLHAILLLAGRFLTKTLDMYSEMLILKKQDKARIFRELGTDYMKKGLYPKAIDSFQQWSVVESTSTESHYSLALALSAAGKNMQALSSLKKVQDLDPQHAGALLQKSKLLLKTKNYTEAAAGLESLLQSNPDDSMSHYLLGVAYERMGNTDKAIHIIARATQLDPNVSKYYHRLAVLYDRCQKHTEAAHCLARIRELTIEENSRKPGTDDDLEPWLQ